MPLSDVGRRAATDRLVRAVHRIAATVHLDRETDPRRVLPVISPAVLWRHLPGLLLDAAALALDRLPDGMTATNAAYLSGLAETIEIGSPAPVIGGEVGRG